MVRVGGGGELDPADQPQLIPRDWFPGEGGPKKKKNSDSASVLVLFWVSVGLEDRWAGALAERGLPQKKKDWCNPLPSLGRQTYG